MNICVQAYMWTYVFTSLRYLPRSKIAGSHGNFVFNFLNNGQTVLQSGCTNLHSHQQCMRVTVSPPSCQLLLLSAFLILAILVGVKWYLMVVLIFISLMTNGVELLFVCLLAICISTLEKCLFKSFTYLKKLDYLSFYYWVVCFLYSLKYMLFSYFTGYKWLKTAK